MGKYTTISVPEDVKAILEKRKGDKEEENRLHDNVFVFKHPVPFALLSEVLCDVFFNMI